MCDYVYNSFLLVEGTFEVAMRTAASVVNMLNSFVDALLYSFKYVINVMLETLIDLVKVAQKTLLDLLWDKLRPDEFCSNLYKCSIILEDLADENSLIWKTCVKAGIIRGNDTDAMREQIYSIINDYNNFKVQICEHGFTTSFGVDALRKLADYINEQVEGIFNYLMKKKDEVRRVIQRFLDDLENLGIFDLLDKLKKYFNCILNSSDKCAAIQSASKYYRNGLAKLHLEENGSNGYRLETSINNKLLNEFDAATTAANNVKGIMDDVAEMLVDPKDVASANKAYDLSKSVFPSGMSWTDIKKARMFRPSTFVDTWKKTGVVKYVTVKYDGLYNAIFGKKDSDFNCPNYMGTDYMIGNTIINDVTGEVTVTINDKSITFNENSKEYKDFAEVNELETGDFYMDITDDEIQNYQNPLMVENNKGMSSIAAAVHMALKPDNELSKKILNKTQTIYERFRNTIPESELVTAWG